MGNVQLLYHQLDTITDVAGLETLYCKESPLSKVGQTFRTQRDARTHLTPNPIGFKGRPE